MSVTSLPWIVKRRLELTHYALRRWMFIARVRIHAFWQRSAVEIDVAPTVQFGKDIRAELTPRTRNVIRIGPHTKIGDRMLFILGGGVVDLADWIDIRRDVVFTVSGRLSLEGRNVIQPGIAIHCDESVVVRRLVGIGERTTIIDSSHYFTSPGQWIDNVKTGPVEIGYSAWVGAMVTVGRNVTIGDHAVIAANSLVVNDVPSGHLASGVPAAVVRRIVPWDDEEPIAGDMMSE